jgi:hypothetical protein
MLAPGLIWWGCMVVISLFNLALLLRLYVTRQGSARTRSNAALFTLVCAYRALLPRIDVPRICFWDTPASWVLFGRLGSTAAELTWTYQFYSLLRAVHRGGAASKVRSTRKVLRTASAAIGLASVAEVFSWTNLISGSDLYSTAEQALWSVLFLMLAAGYGGTREHFVARVGLHSERPVSNGLMDWTRVRYIVTLRAFPLSAGYKLIAALLVLMGAEQAYGGVHCSSS